MPTRCVVIDPGHGGKDPGAIGTLCGREADVNLAVALALSDRLTRRPLAPGHWIRVDLTRTSDVYLPLARRAAVANLDHADLLVSIHCNAAGDPRARGFEVWTSPGATSADQAATAIWLALRAAVPGRRGRVDMVDGDVDKEAHFTVLTATRCPAVLVELGFISNVEDDALLASPEGRAACVAALEEGIRGWLTDRYELLERR